MDQATHNKIVSFIWGIADDVLRDLFRRGKYPDVILPMFVIRRMDAVLEPTKQVVLDTKKMLDGAHITEQRAALYDAAGQAFYNTSRFTLRDLKSRGSQQQLLADFDDYLNGYSPNVQDILENFKFRNQLSTLSKADALGTLVNKFLDPEIDLSPAGIDNHAMGTVFEELVRKFNEENNEEAGEHWTPRDAVRLMANLVFLPIEAALKSGTYLLYDCACGTGGMLTVAEETLMAIAAKGNQQIKTLLYGQEINPETYAVCKADMLLKGEGESADHNLFYNTGIATYVWVLSNRKPAHRKGQVQLIDASQWFKPLRKNLGKKNCELSPDDIERISRTFLDFKETPESKIFPNAAFGYWKVTVERPLRLHSRLSLKAIETLRFASGDEDLRATLFDEFGDDLFTQFAKISAALEKRLAEWGGDEDECDDEEGGSAKKGLPEKKQKKLLDAKTWERDGRLVDVAAKLREALGGELFEDYNKFRDRVDASLKKAGIKLPAADLKLILKAVSWRVETAPPVIATRHFYKPQPLRTLAEISADILAIEKEAEGLLDGLLKGTAKS